MDTGFSTSDAILTQAMSNGNRGGNSNWGNGGCGAPFADPASNAVRINRNADVAEANDRCTKEVLSAGMNRIADQAEEGRRQAQNTVLVDTLVNSEFRTSDRIAGLKDGQFAGELRTGDRLRDLEREASANAKIAADCCCDLKLQSCEDKAQILAAIAAQTAVTLAVESRGIERNLNAVNAELTSLKTQIACGCNCPS